MCKPAIHVHMQARLANFHIHMQARLANFHIHMQARLANFHVHMQARLANLKTSSRVLANLKGHLKLRELLCCEKLQSFVAISKQLLEERLS